MAVAKIVLKHRGLVYRVLDENRKFKENYLRRRAIMHAQNLRQLEHETLALQAQMMKGLPAVQREYLRMRARHIQQRVQEENSGY